MKRRAARIEVVFAVPLLLSRPERSQPMAKLISRNQRTSFLVLAALLAGFALGACASGGGSADSPAAAPAPVKKAFVAPEWDSTEFRSEDGVFFVHYPSDFQEQPAQAGGVLSVASPSLVPRVDVSTLDGVQDSSIEEVGAGLIETMKQLGGGEAEITASQMVKLSDEVTDAMRFDVNWSFQGFPLTSVVLVVPTETYAINLLVTGMDGGDLAELEGIANTLTLP